jgi:pentatricopeptide repeat protein
MHKYIKYFLSAIAGITLSSAAVMFFSCSEKSPEQIVKPEDTRPFLSAEIKNPQLDIIENRIKFFTDKAEKDNYGAVTAGMLASAYSARFEITADINDLTESARLLDTARVKYNNSSASNLLSLSANSLMRHEFKKSVDYAYDAYILGEHKSLSTGILFDAYIETGNYEQARRLLSSIQNINEFPYLIRASKYKEITGDMDSAVIFMQLALDEAKKNPTRPGLITWTYNSLAAIYIKNGEYEKAYELYLSSLKIDPNNHKSLEGIALICSVNDQNYAFSGEILLFIAGKIQSPDSYLNLYKTAKLKGDELKKKEYLDKFIQLSSNPLYGKMYNKYMAEIYAEEFGDFTRALQIAEDEISERPAPSSYFLLAWIYYKKGDNEKAVEIIKDKVEDKTYDPDILAKIDRIFLTQTGKI